jgi:phosphopantetheine--protein transferase-like protein
MTNLEPESSYRVRTGIDIVAIEEFRRSLESGGDIMRGRLFSPAEVGGAGIERLAGIFAAKEAAFKALELPLGDWLVLEIGHEPNGRPRIALRPDYDASRIIDLDLSISHSGGIAVASVVALIRTQQEGSQV